MLVKAFESEDLVETKGSRKVKYLEFQLPLSLVNHPTSLLFHKSSATLFFKEGIRSKPPLKKEVAQMLVKAFESEDLVETKGSRKVKYP